MSAVVRVKRRISEEPLSGFVLNCKKHKINDEIHENLFETKDEVSTVLKFAATVESQDDHAVSQLNRLTKTEAEILAQKTRKPKNVTEKSRQEMRENIHENRFKVVNCYRTINDEETNPKGITIVDIEKQQQEQEHKNEINLNSNKKSEETASQSSLASNNSSINVVQDENFVYDLYLPENNEQTDHTDYIENYSINNISVRPFDDLFYDERYKDDSDNNDSEDSNCEDYYKNDYPDSDEENYDNNSINDDDIRKAVEDIDLDGDRNLSSDDETNSFVNTIDLDNEEFHNDIDYCDVSNRYGEAYARYRARNINKNNSVIFKTDDELDYLDSDSD